MGRPSLERHSSAMNIRIVIVERMMIMIALRPDVSLIAQPLAWQASERTELLKERLSNEIVSFFGPVVSGHRGCPHRMRR